MSPGEVLTVVRRLPSKTFVAIVNAEIDRSSTSRMVNVKRLLLDGATAATLIVRHRGTFTQLPDDRFSVHE